MTRLFGSLGGGGLGGEISQVVHPQARIQPIYEQADGVDPVHVCDGGRMPRIPADGRP